MNFNNFYAILKRKSDKLSKIWKVQYKGIKYNFLPNVLLFIILIPCIMFGQNNGIEFNRLTLRHGLSNNTVNCIVEDSTGYIWIGTDDGLNRFDSRSIKKYLSDANVKGSLPSGKVRSLLIDSKNNLWIGTKNGLALYDYKKDFFTTYFKGEYIRDLCENRFNNLLLVTNKHIIMFD